MKIIIHGINGKMGQVLLSTAENHGIEVVAGVDVKEKEYPFPFFTKIENCNVKADAIIDFSIAAAVPALLNYAAKNNTALVVCTTGLIDDTLNMVNQTAKLIPIFKSANMSLGVNLLVNLVQKAARSLYDANFDIEIIEKHHNQKVDAPSGTALLFANAIKESLQGNMEFTYDRSQTREKRQREEIGLHAIRGGTIVGEHEIIFAGNDEVISLSHSAMSKDIFAVGALQAAKFIKDKPAGLYNMNDLFKNI